MPIGEVLLWAEFSDSRRLSLEMKKPFQLSKTPHQLADVASLFTAFFCPAFVCPCGSAAQGIFYCKTGDRKDEAKI